MMSCVPILLIPAFVHMGSTETTGAHYLTCRNCAGTNPGCWTTCRGLYCYKAEMLTADQSTVSSGCVNLTDKRVQANHCEETSSLLPGSSTKITERLCICSSDKCNVTTSKLISLLLLFSLALFLFCL